MNRLMSWVNRRAGAIIVVIAVASGTLYAVQVYDQRATTNCQARYNRAFAEQLTVRSRLSGVANDATQALLNGVGTALGQKPTTDPKVQQARSLAFLKLFSTYKEASEALEEDRRQHPLPPIPNC